jgi:hypothetical protein
MGKLVISIDPEELYLDSKTVLGLKVRLYRLLSECLPVQAH